MTQEGVRNVIRRTMSRLRPPVGSSYQGGLNMRKLLGVLVTGALLLSACGGDGGPDPSEDPKGALVEAFRDLTERDGISLTLSIDSDEESLQTFLEDGGSDVPEGTAGTILDSSLSLASNNASEPEEASSELTLELGGEEAAAIVVDGYDFYARADVPYIMETFGSDPGSLDQQLAQVPPGFDFLEQAVDGEWIHLTGLQQFVEQAAKSGQAGQIAPNPGEQQKKMLEGLARILEENSEVSEGDEEGPGTHLEAKLDLRSFAQEFQGIIGQLSMVPGAGQELPAPPSDLPEGDLILDAWVDDGALTQVELDLLKNAEALGEGEPAAEGVGDLGLLVTFEDFDGDVDPPDDAIEVSVQDILGTMMGGLGRSGGTGGGSGQGQVGDICKEVSELPAQQQEPFKEICPDI